uniref:Uncharacterized protein n=1 Tax=Avena sativa TaxID=4498 RepID=A0ACD5VMS1_AVESA
MVDAVGTIAKIVEVALKIKGAAETVKQNEDVCKQIKSRVEILGNTFSQHQNNTELMSNLAVRYSLEALDEILVEAFKLVMDCQEETNFVCLFYTAGKLSRELIQVEQRISSRNVDAILAIMGFLLTKQSNQDGANPQSPSQQVDFCSRPTAFQFQAMEPPNLSKQMRRQNEGREDVNIQTEDSYEAIFKKVREERLAAKEPNARVSEVHPVSSDGQWDSSMDALCSCCAMTKKRKHVPRRSSTPHGQQNSLLDQIEEVSLDIQEAVETVLQNKVDCAELDKRVSRASVVLSQLKNTDMVEEQAKKVALKKLLETFRHAHTLVMACQRSGIVTMLICTQPYTLSKQLSAVLDRLVPDINAMVAVIVNCTLSPQRYTQTRNTRDQPVRAPPMVQPSRRTAGAAEGFRPKRIATPPPAGAI